MQPDRTANPTPGSNAEPGKHPARHDAHTPNPTDTPAAPEPDADTATDAATATPEPDSSSTPHTPRQTTPASPEQPDHTDTPAAHAEPAHAATQPAAARPPSVIPPPDTPRPRDDKPESRPRLCLSPLQMPVSPECFRQVYALALAAGIDTPEGVDPETGAKAALTGVDALSKFAPARAVMFLSIVASGARHREAFQASGLSQIDVNLFCKLDESFGKLYDLAKRLQGDSIAQQTLDAARDRAIDGVDEPMIGRVGKDEDGIVAYRRRYSDKLAEVLLKATDSRFRDAAPTTQNAATIYNIQVLHPGNAPDDQAPAKVGGKTAAKQQQESQAIDAEALTLD